MGLFSPMSSSHGEMVRQVMVIWPRWSLLDLRLRRAYKVDPDQQRRAGQARFQTLNLQRVQFQSELSNTVRLANLPTALYPSFSIVMVTAMSLFTKARATQRRGDVGFRVAFATLKWQIRLFFIQVDVALVKSLWCTGGYVGYVCYKE